MRRKLSLLLLAALLLGGCGRAETVADPVEETLRLFYPCSLVRGADGLWYSLDAAGGGAGSPLETALAGSGTVVNPLAPLASAVPEALICNDNPFVRVTPLARQIEAGETMTLPLRVEQKERELGDNPLDSLLSGLTAQNDNPWLRLRAAAGEVPAAETLELPLLEENDTGYADDWLWRLENPQLEIRLGEGWYRVPATCERAGNGGLQRTPGQAQDSVVRFQVQGEQAADEAGLRYASAPAAPPAGHYRVAWLCNLSGLADAGDWAAAHPGMVSTVSGKEGPYALLTVEFDIVA